MSSTPLSAMLMSWFAYARFGSAFAVVFGSCLGDSLGGVVAADMIVALVCGRPFLVAGAGGSKLVLLWL